MRQESPPWDIERGAPLAVDEDSGSVAPGSGLEENAREDADVDVDVDMDIAPALRAKRRRA